MISQFTPPPRRCEPPFWAQGGHAQTLLGFFIPSPRLNELGKDFTVSLTDGDRLACTLIEGTSNHVIYVFHGLAGDTESGYMHRTANLCRAFGHTVILANHRGAGRGKDLAQGIYHSGSAPDLSQVIEWGRKKFANKKHLAIGFSLSGNALLLLVSEARGGCIPDAAIAVNSPIDLSNASLLLKTGLNRIYDLHFTYLLRKGVRARGKEVQIPLLTSVWEFDELYTAREGGFRDRDDYYRSSSTKPLLRQIRIPTVLLTAEDDPFVPVSDYREAVLSPSCHLHIEKTGGHMGYLSAQKTTPEGSRRWLDYALGHYIKQMTG